MVATMFFLHILLCIVGMGGLALAQNRTSVTSVLSLTLSNLTTSKTLVASTVLVTSTPGGGTVKATTVVTQTGYQNTTSLSFEVPAPTLTTPNVFTQSAINTPASPPSSTPTLLQNAAPLVKFDVLPIVGSALAFLVGLCVFQ
jgi:hypothetical protein